MAWRQLSLLFLHSQQCLELLLLPGTNDRQNLQPRTVSACSSLWATVSPSRKLFCTSTRWPLRKTALEYVCVCAYTFFSQLDETTALKHQAFFTILVKGKPFLKSDTYLILPFPTSCHECHPSWPLILYFNVRKYDSTVLSLSHCIIFVITLHYLISSSLLYIFFRVCHGSTLSKYIQTTRL